MKPDPRVVFAPGNVLFSPLSSDALAQLADDIKANGLRERITFRWVDDGLIEVIHGRFRLEALKSIGADLFRDGQPVDTYFREFDQARDGDPTQFMISANIRTRRLYEDVANALRESPSVVPVDQITRHVRGSKAPLKDEKAGTRKKKQREPSKSDMLQPSLPSFEAAIEILARLGPLSSTLEILEDLLHVRSRLGGSTEQALAIIAAGFVAIDHLASAASASSKARVHDLLVDALADARARGTGKIANATK